MWTYCKNMYKQTVESVTVCRYEEGNTTTAATSWHFKVKHACIHILQRCSSINLLHMFSASHHCHNIWCLLQIHIFYKRNPAILNVTAKCAGSPYCGQMSSWLSVCLSLCPSLGVRCWHSWTICSQISREPKISQIETNTRADTYMCTLMKWLSQCVFCSASQGDSHTHTHTKLWSWKVKPVTHASKSDHWHEDCLNRNMNRSLHWGGFKENSAQTDPLRAAACSML